MADFEVKDEQATRFVVHDEVDGAAPLVDQGKITQNEEIGTETNTETRNQASNDSSVDSKSNKAKPDSKSNSNDRSYITPDLLQYFCKNPILVILGASLICITYLIFNIDIIVSGNFAYQRGPTDLITLIACFYFAILAGSTQNRLNRLFGKDTLDLKIKTGIPALGEKWATLLFAVNPLAWFLLDSLFLKDSASLSTGIWLLDVILLLFLFFCRLFVIGQSVAFLAWQFVYPVKLHAALHKISHKKQLGMFDSLKSLIFLAIFWLSCVFAPLMTMVPDAGKQTFFLVFAVVMQCGIFVAANKLIDKAKNKPVEQEEEIKTPILLDCETEIAYKPMAGAERWVKQRFSQSSPWKGLALAAMVAIILLLNPGDMVAQLLATLFGKTPKDDGNLPGIAQTVKFVGLNLNYIFVLLFGGTFTASIMAFGYWLLRLPKSLAVGPNGIRFLYHKASRKADTSLKWRDLQSIKIEQSVSKNQALNQAVVFKTKAKSIKLKLDNFKTPDEREKLLHQIEMYAPNTPRDAEVMELLAKPADHSYTEIWLTALSAPPKRERLKPLTPGAAMHDGNYTVLNELGSGGQGFAYLARDKDGNEVVLKEFVLPIYVDIQARRRALERFENEASLLSRLDHPQVVKLNSFFIEDHRAYLVLEHIDGQNLRQLVAQNGPLSQEQVKELHTKMQAILDYLHGLSPPLVHRDFTPDNLILDKAGNLKLIDFNVAQEMQDGTTGTVVGKQSYLPPEQFRGQAEPASDLYAMGATLYYLLTGKDPTPISTIHIAQELPDIDASLDNLLTKLTALDPNNRENTDLTK
ncbi:MAG: Serine/threonine protein kinase [Cyanobacteriota bacterium erpe_2018_sw_39hr_WHONDRS-SW48-000098_B_bin.30]|nr:Serine/threonine protein kinase [Cyanobacteriota bacterium erpe_2018_sw_39hr_WHONDRS-SW48-000098_B_bin.30]